MRFIWDEGKRISNQKKHGLDFRDAEYASFRCEKLQNMSKESTSHHSETDWDYIDNLKDEEIDLSDIPEITEEQFSKAKLRIGGRPVQRGKVRVNMYLDADIVSFFKQKAGKRGYQTLINETLRQSISQEDLETLLRRIIREEIHT